MAQQEIKNDISVSSRIKHITDEKDLKIIDFIIDYSFKDEKQVYTNGTILVPLYRVLDAISQSKEQNKRVYNEGYRDAEREWGGHGDKDISEYNNAEQYSLPGVNDAKVIKSSPNFIKENSQHSSIKKK
jgi:hypothetical protein